MRVPILKTAKAPENTPSAMLNMLKHNSLYRDDPAYLRVVQMVIKSTCLRESLIGAEDLALNHAIFRVFCISVISS